jgi:hypothetical protein
LKFVSILLPIFILSCTNDKASSSLEDIPKRSQNSGQTNSERKLGKKLFTYLQKNFGNLANETPTKQNTGSKCLTCVDLVTNKTVTDYFDKIARRLDPTYTLAMLNTEEFFSVALPGRLLVISVANFRVAQSDGEAAGIIASAMAQEKSGAHSRKFSNLPTKNKNSTSQNQTIWKRLLNEPLPAKGGETLAYRAVRILKQARYTPAEYYVYLASIHGSESSRPDLSAKSLGTIAQRRNAFKIALLDSGARPSYQRKPSSRYLKIWKHLNL